MFKEDRVLADRPFNLVSLEFTKQRNERTNPESDFELCSDRMQRLYPDYTFDNQGFLPKPGAETVNFANLKALLLSKDMQQYALLNQMTLGGKCLMLDGTVDLC